MKYLYLIILLLSVGSLPLMGQGRVRFAYDAAGNRVRRELVVGSKKPKGLRTLSTDSTQQTTSALDPRDEVDRRHLRGRDYVTETIDRGQVRIYPNPTEGELTIEFLGYRPEQRAVLVVYDLFGRVQVSTSYISLWGRIDLRGRSGRTNKPNKYYTTIQLCRPIHYALSSSPGDSSASVLVVCGGKIRMHQTPRYKSKAMEIQSSRIRSRPMIMES